MLATILSYYSGSCYSLIPPITVFRVVEFNTRCLSTQNLTELWLESIICNTLILIKSTVSVFIAFKETRLQSQNCIENHTAHYKNCFVFIQFDLRYRLLPSLIFVLFIYLLGAMLLFCLLYANEMSIELWCIRVDCRVTSIVYAPNFAYF